jgi:hypothetical protein
MSVKNHDPLYGWSHSRSPVGSFESIQRVKVPAPVVEHSAAGAKRLGDVYWSEIDHSLYGLIRARERSGVLELRVFGVGPALLRFGPPEHLVTPAAVTCRYPILGGLLTRMPTGTISFTQTTGTEVELSSAIHGFFPRLAPRRLRRGWNGVLYHQIQARLHVALGRRYFARLREEATR